ncbi:MAG: hypothetical protein A2494_00700 [Candidatus Lloydbacteria bacterium RIFOXYC12_FULL_46_25]|uniref:Uncharacterized protein n=1 Tax=Candidatus Lloydbacteria bacterium RIFOXYC12_FULL_46_25 TaxID=1798670 RepID=A0A1G2DWL5_9BACT|nr:MAG: hypothetical protein A2494_00700 [Candidatus Lloydbacteria bacterium RIFOXYC12_FULL_46_25]
MLTALAIMLGMVAALVLIGVIALPFVAPHLANDPQNPRRYYVFTKVEPNQFKFVMVGGKVHKGLMNFPGYHVSGGNDGPNAYNVIPGATTEPERMNFLEQMIYDRSGHRYVGIIFGNLHTYSFPRVKEVLRPDGTLDIVGKTDTSDHFVLSEQTHRFDVPNVETGGEENVLVTYTGKFTVQIVNPYKAAFVAREQWLQQIIAALRVRGRNYARARTFDQLLGAKEDTSAGGKEAALQNIGSDLIEVNNHIEAGRGSEELWGVRLLRVQVEDIQMTDSKAEESRTKMYVAKRDAEVKQISATAEARAYMTVKAGRAKGDAGYLKSVTDAIHEKGNVAVMLTQQQTQIETAKGANNVFLNVGSGGPVNPIDAAILTELQQMNSSRNPPPKESGGGNKRR